MTRVGRECEDHERVSARDAWSRIYSHPGRFPDPTNPIGSSSAIRRPSSKTLQRNLEDPPVQRSLLLDPSSRINPNLLGFTQFLSELNCVHEFESVELVRVISVCVIAFLLLVRFLLELELECVGKENPYIVLGQINHCWIGITMVRISLHRRRERLPDFSLSYITSNKKRWSFFQEQKKTMMTTIIFWEKSNSFMSSC